MDTKESYPTIKDFVLQQAHQRAFQTLVLGLKDFEKQKAKIFTDKREVINGQFDKRGKQKLATRRIQKSALINNSRMQKMRSRNNFLQEIVTATQVKLANNIVKNQSEYKKLLKNMIVQGLIKLFEPTVFVRCLRRDENLIRQVLNESKNQFANLIKRQGIPQQIGIVNLQIDKYYLEERTVGNGLRVLKSEENLKCFGGIILTNKEGDIVCKNTLDTRIQLAYQHMLPAIRKQLFE